MRPNTNDPRARARLLFTLAACGLLYAVSTASADDCLPHWENTIGQPGMNGAVLTLTVIDKSSDFQKLAPGVYAGGNFTSAGGQAVNHIARWDGSQWSPVGTGMNNSVVALTVFEDTSGNSKLAPGLYAGGTFTSAGGTPAAYIARWDGTEWSPLGSGLNHWVRALTVFDDGTGPALYAGGSFNNAGGMPANRIAKWDGAEWSPLGSGMTGGQVYVLSAFDDGSGDGPVLYAGGTFNNAGGTPANRIAKWDGLEWTPLGSGVHHGGVSALTVFDDGVGPALYVGGGFVIAGLQTVNYIAKWDGNLWSPLGSGMGWSGSNTSVRSLAVYDDNTGDGPAVYAGGWFPTAGGQKANNIAKWDGSEWSPLPPGVSSTVIALTVFDDDSETGPALYAGGSFSSMGCIQANRIARWICTDVDVPVGDLNRDFCVDVQDLYILIGSWGLCADCDDCPADLSGDCVVNVSDLFILFDNWD